MNDLDALPDQTGQADKALFTDGTNAAWQNIPEGLPEQTGNAGKALFSDGTNASWGVVDGGGRKNLLINGNKWVNQRGFVGDWSALSVGAYGYDRWKKHASGIEQIIEGGYHGAGTYTLSWQGDGSGFVNGAAVENGGQAVISNTSDHISVVVPETAMDIQFEWGDHATQFQYVDPATLYLQCQRYFQAVFVQKVILAIYNSNGDTRSSTHTLSCPMRTVPTVSPSTFTNNGIGISGAAAIVNRPTLTFQPNVHTNFSFSIVGTGGGTGITEGAVLISGFHCDTWFLFDAEL